MKIGLFWRVLPAYFIIASFFALPLWQRHSALIKAQESAYAAQAKLAEEPAGNEFHPVKGVPERVIIPRLAVDVKVLPGNYDHSLAKWSVSKSDANYALNTALANNEKDRTLIYGHWSPKVFGPTRDLKAGDDVYVYTDNGHVFQYAYRDHIVLKPHETKVFDRFKGQPGLVLLTCQGVKASERRVMFFDLVKAS